MDLGLKDRAMVITGGSDGLGREIALQASAAGARVAVIARKASTLDRTVADCEAAGALLAVAVVADLSQRGRAEAAVAEAVDRLGGIDVLVNNVGQAHISSLDELDDDAWVRSFEINLLSHVGAIRAALPGLRASDQARIVNIASTAGKRPSAGMPDYSVMKAALLSLSRLVADVEAKNGILCNAVCPGPIATPTWLAPGGLAEQTAHRSGATVEEVLARVGAGRPLGRLAAADEIAAVCLLLASARASFVTGAAWSVDGGTVPIII